VQYRVEVYDPMGLRVDTDDVPLLEVRRALPDQSDVIAGMLPTSIARLGPVCRPVCSSAGIVLPSDCKDSSSAMGRFANTHSGSRERAGVVAFEAEQRHMDRNAHVECLCRNCAIPHAVRDLINRASPYHYAVSHEAYPDGAMREFAVSGAQESAE
jgi:hypothetical protein